MKHRVVSSSLLLLCVAQAACILTTSGSTSDTNADASASASPSDDGSDSADDARPAPSEATSATPSTDSDSTATVDGTSSSEGTDDADTTAAEATSSETTGAAGTCGWVEAMQWYDCGGVGEDPEGFIPMECEEPPVAGAPCEGGQGPIADPGCCFDGVSAYCYLGELIVEVCG